MVNTRADSKKLRLTFDKIQYPLVIKSLSKNKNESFQSYEGHP